MSSWNYYYFFYVTFPASTDWTCHPTRATSNWRRSWCLQSRRRKASDRSERNQEKFFSSESEGRKTTSVQIREPFHKKGGCFTFVVLLWPCVCVRLLPACCCKGAGICIHHVHHALSRAVNAWLVREKFCILLNQNTEAPPVSKNVRQIMHGILKTPPLLHLFNGTAVVFPSHTWFCTDREQGGLKVTVRLS